MYYFFTLMIGMLISIMLAFNGGLTERYGAYSATVLIHIVGLAFITTLVLINRDRVFSQRARWFLYLGGAIGVFTTTFINISFGRINLSAIVALGLLGQSIFGILVDQYGLLGMPKHPFSKGTLAGIVLMILGVASMMYSFEALAVILAFSAGITIVLARTLNAKLASVTNLRISTFHNYTVGLVIAIIVFFLLGREERLFYFNMLELSPSFFIYFGGLLGVCVVLTSNVIVMKVSAFSFTLLAFIGKIFAGILIDIIISGELSYRNLIGGVLVSVGLVLNLLLDSKRG